MYSICRASSNKLKKYSVSKIGATFTVWKNCHFKFSAFSFKFNFFFLLIMITRTLFSQSRSEQFTIYFFSRTSLQKDNFDDDHLLEILRTKDTQVTFKFLFCKGQKISEQIFLSFNSSKSLQSDLASKIGHRTLDFDFLKVRKSQKQFFLASILPRKPKNLL